MLIAFRADASIQIGTGHVMRCLTLASALKAQGHECLFICRDHKGHLGEFITGNGFALHMLTMADEAASEPVLLDWNDHAPWLGVSWQQDARETGVVLEEQPVDWLVVDHYALDARWELQVAEHATRALVIDDLADRPHCCDLLLDQTFGRRQQEYHNWVPESCELLCGSQYALLRPEFAELRPYSMQRRAKPPIRQLLITMGGVDKDNVTGQVLDALRDSELPGECRIVVVMGPTAPWLETVKHQAEKLPWQTEVKCGVSNMAQLMADSDLAIGAAGATSWERCCLGLPTIMLVLAANQTKIAKELSQSGAAFLPEQNADSESELKRQLNQLVAAPRRLVGAAQAAAAIVDSKGVQRVMQRMVS